MSEREAIIDLIRNEYDPRPNLGSADYPGFEWDDGAGRIADAILADRALMLQKIDVLVKALEDLRNEVAGDLVDTSKEHLITNADAVLARLKP